MIGWLRKRNSLWSNPVLYGIGGFGLIALGIIGVRLLFMPAPVVAEPITPENIEAHIKSWADSFGLSIRKDSSSPNSYFQYTLTLSDGVSVDVARMKDRDRYLTLRAKITVSPEHKAVMSNWSNEEAVRLADELLLELARAKVSYSIAGLPRFDEVVVMEMVLISNDLSGDTFVRSLDDLDSQVMLVKEEVRLLAARNNHAKPR